METDYVANLIPRLLLTLATLGYGAVTLKADLNRTHATNPLWTPHARFHVVWQVLSYAGIALIALALTWTPGPLAVERLYLAAGLGATVYSAFFLALLARPLFGGSLYDENGYPPFPLRLVGRGWRWDANVTAFTSLTVLLLAAVATISRPG